MLTSQRVVSTSLLVSTGAVVCYPVSIMNLIWFTNEKIFIVSALSNIGTWNQESCDPKTQPSRKLGVLVHCLARTRKSSAIPTDT